MVLAALRDVTARGDKRKTVDGTSNVQGIRNVSNAIFSNEISRYHTRNHRCLRLPFFQQRAGNRIKGVHRAAHLTANGVSEVRILGASAAQVGGIRIKAITPPSPMNNTGLV